MKAFIFDMDGTLIDNMAVHHKAWQTTLSELGMPLTLEEVKLKCHGKNEEILEKLFPNKYSEEQLQEISLSKELIYQKQYINDLKPIDGLMAFLDDAKAKNIPLGIGTAAPETNVNFVLNNLPIRHYFDSVIHSGMVSKGKPDPEVFQKVADELGYDLAECIVFEDSPTGAQTSQNAGCKSVILITTHSEDEFDKYHNIKMIAKDYTGLVVSEIQNL
jgi:HAD superfamily hydrolase (TIGR01509 family)